MLEASLRKYTKVDTITVVKEFGEMLSLNSPVSGDLGLHAGDLTGSKLGQTAIVSVVSTCQQNIKKF